jgi:hypothetical protein
MLELQDKPHDRRVRRAISSPNREPLDCERIDDKQQRKGGQQAGAVEREELESWGEQRPLQ